VEVRYYATEAGRSPADDFIASLAEPYRGQIRADLTVLERHGDKAPVSKKAIKGHKPMWELRIGGFRIFFVRSGDVYWILGACKKQNQDREIAACAKRMTELRGG
jgi:mRNA-degrading endonuclease RelE of RelBE toxin-antitoxin system